MTSVINVFPVIREIQKFVILNLTHYTDIQFIYEAPEISISVHYVQFYHIQNQFQIASNTFMCFLGTMCTVTDIF